MKLQLRFTRDPHRYLIMGYPVFHRETVQKELRGFLLNPSFRHHYADNWLPFFIGEHGEVPIVCSDTSLRGIGTAAVIHTTTTVNDEYDYKVFIRLVQDFTYGFNREYV